MLHDLKVRDCLKKRLKHAGRSQDGHRASRQERRVTCSPPARASSSARRARTSKALKRDLQKIVGVPVHVNIEEVQSPN